MKQAAIEQAEAEAAACAKAATTAAVVPDSQHAAPDPASCAQGGVLGTNVNGDCGRSSTGVNNQQQGGTKQAVGASLPVVQDSSYARGRSVCLALLNRSEPEEYAHCCEVGGMALKLSAEQSPNAFVDILLDSKVSRSEKCPRFISLEALPVA